MNKAEEEHLSRIILSIILYFYHFVYLYFVQALWDWSLVVFLNFSCQKFYLFIKLQNIHNEMVFCVRTCTRSRCFKNLNDKVCSDLYNISPLSMATHVKLNCYFSMTTFLWLQWELIVLQHLPYRRSMSLNSCESIAPNVAVAKSSSNCFVSFDAVSINATIIWEQLLLWNTVQ
jgi:hypothetical protein